MDFTPAETARKTEVGDSRSRRWQTRQSQDGLVGVCVWNMSSSLGHASVSILGDKVGDVKEESFRGGVYG